MDVFVCFFEVAVGREEQGKRLIGAQSPMATKFWAGPLNFDRKWLMPIYLNVKYSVLAIWAP